VIIIYKLQRSTKSTMTKLASKKCIRCGETKPIHVFEKKKRELNYRNICKCCRNHANKTASTLKRKYVKIHGQPPPYSPCSICQKKEKSLVFDHCHKTDQFRGWLCRSCNCAISKLGDDSIGLLRAVHSLQTFENKL
jgi:hypothetical protein